MTDLALILEDCLTRMGQGETLEACLARYPQDAEELRRMLATAAQVSDLGAIQPAPDYKARGRSELLAHMRSHPRRAPKGRKRLAALFPRPVQLGYALAALMMVFLAAGTAYAQSALPGDSFYNWKRNSEKVWRFVVRDRFETDLKLLERRASELLGVASDMEREAIGSQAYLETLAILAIYDEPGEHATLIERVKAHQARFAAAGINILPTDLPPATPGSEDSPGVTPTPETLEQFLEGLLSPTAPGEGLTATPSPSPTQGLLPTLIPSALPTVLPGIVPTEVPGSGVLP